MAFGRLPQLLQIHSNLEEILIHYDVNVRIMVDHVKLVVLMLFLIGFAVKTILRIGAVVREARFPRVVVKIFVAVVTLDVEKILQTAV